MVDHLNARNLFRIANEAVTLFSQENKPHLYSNEMFNKSIQRVYFFGEKNAPITLELLIDF